MQAIQLQPASEAEDELGLRQWGLSVLLSAKLALPHASLPRAAEVDC